MLAYFVIFFVAGWFCTRSLVVRLCENLSDWIGEGADIMAGNIIGFVLGGVFVFVLFYSFGSTVKIVITAFVLGLVSNWVVSAILESEGKNTDRWFLVLDTGRELSVHAANYAAHALPALAGVVG